MKKPKLFLIDASSFIFRAYYAIRRLSTSQGLPTNATYGFVTMLLKVIEQHKPDYVTCIFDTPAPSFRKEMYADYKANRGAPPDDLLPQFEHIHKAVEVLGIHKVAEPGYEADDIIGTFAKKFSNCEIVIVSTDKDLMQLVNERVVMLDTMKDLVYTPKQVEEKLGVPPAQVCDYLGLIGDTSDNIPGVPGIGPKGAVELLKEYGSLEAILSAAPAMKPGRKKDTLVENSSIAKLSKELATVKCDIDGRIQSIALDELKSPDGVGKDFLVWAHSLEFNALVKKYGDTNVVTLPAKSAMEVSSEFIFPDVSIIRTRDEWARFLNSCERTPRIAFDTETRGTKTTDLEIVGLSLSCGRDSAVYVPLRHSEYSTDLKPKEVLEGFAALCEKKTAVAQNLKYDYKILLSEGLNGFPAKDQKFFDTMLAHYILEPDEKHGLDVLSTRYLGVTIGDFKETLGDRENFSLVPLAEAAKYSGMDAWSCFCLSDILEKKLEEKNLTRLFWDIEMPVAPVLAHMEWDGVAVDTSILNKLSSEFGSELDSIEKKIFELVGTTFNLNSPKQLSEILFNKLKLPVIQKTKTGFSTDVTVLEKLAPLHPVPELLLSYREFTKLKNTYVDVIPALVEKDGRVHARFNQAVTTTGRLSSSDPNLQNIPIKTDRGRRIRQAFVAEAGNVLIGADYSQIELRLVAHLSGDKALIQAFRDGADIHRATAAEIFSVRQQDVTDSQRAAAKAINFGLIYGKTAFGLSQELKISRASAAQYIEAYFKRYSGVKRYMDETLEKARKYKEVETYFGRKRPLRDIENKNAAVRANSERMAMNAPVQGTAADLIKLAMVRVFEKTRAYGARMVLQVHDELVLEVPQQQAGTVEEVIRSEMESVVELEVPLSVNLGAGKNWYEL